MILQTQQQGFGQIWIIQYRDTIFKGFINFVYVALSGGTLLIYVMSQQYNSLSNGTIHQILQNFTFHENVFSLFFYRYVRAQMNVYAFMNELDQKDYWYPRKEIVKIYVQSQWRVILLWYGRVPSREGDIHNFA